VFPCRHARPERGVSSASARFHPRPTRLFRLLRADFPEPAKSGPGHSHPKRSQLPETAFRSPAATGSLEPTATRSQLPACSYGASSANFPRAGDADGRRETWFPSDSHRRSDKSLADDLALPSVVAPRPVRFRGLGGSTQPTQFHVSCLPKHHRPVTVRSPTTMTVCRIIVCGPLRFARLAQRECPHLAEQNTLPPRGGKGVPYGSVGHHV
jgi:hypothetical protein